jgi:quercetin dioxygenase-like cupin family protein
MTSLAASAHTPANGPIVGNSDAPTTYYNLMGGQGTVKLKRLLSGPQMASTLDIAEHVAFLEGASCGHHRHTRAEEFYYVLGGDGVVDVDGERLPALGGDLIITPLNSAHKIGGRGNSSVAILVVEVLPGPGGRRGDPTRIAMPELLAREAASPVDGVRVATVDLAKHLTGAWGPFQLAALEPGASLGPHAISDAEQFLYLASGDVRFEFGDWREAGSAGLYAVVPPGTAWTIVNTSARNRAEVAITQVGVP